MTALPPFATTMVGSWPRPQRLLQALRARQAGALDEAAFEREADEAVLRALRAQLAAGLDVVTDGEQRRDNFYSFVAERLAGVQLMTLAEMLDLVEDKDGFRRILDTLDVPAYAIRNPTCTGRIARRAPLAASEVAFLRRHTGHPVKVALPGPYLLTRAMWVKEASRETYPTKESLGDDVVRVLREEIADVVAAGAAFVQLDEPVLTEVVFTQGHTRTFMCASLAARKDPAEELAFAVDLLQRVLAGFESVRTGLHVCRGNWSTRDETLLSGSYAPLRETFARIPVTQLVLEYATPRAGDWVPMPGRELGLGVVNPRTEEVESVERITTLVERALRDVPPGKLWLNPDCGFGTFASRPMNTPERATEKLRRIVEAARSVRERLG